METSLTYHDHVVPDQIYDIAPAWRSCRLRPGIELVRGSRTTQPFTQSIFPQRPTNEITLREIATVIAQAIQ